MILKKTLKEIVKSQKDNLSKYDFGIKREILNDITINKNFALVISGIRRCGKSTLLIQLMKELPNFYYMNFEDTRLLSFDNSDFQKLDEIYIKEYGESEYYFLDEIQNIQQWEIFVRSRLDQGKKFVITGSNASLLSKELGTKLTGRHLRYELFPFSYREMLQFLNKDSNIASFDYYLKNGGFPEFLKLENEQILQELFNDIVLRDIVARYGIRESKLIIELGIYLLTNVGKEFSFNNLKKIFHAGSINTIISFISYFEESYLLFTISRFSYSLKKQLVNPKKVYSIDNGLTRANSISFSADHGRMLENLVFQELKRRNKKIFYFKENGECDFVIKEKEKITLAIQVCYELNENNMKREFDGLIEALIKFNLNEGLILTYDDEDEVKYENKKIIIKPVWKWI
ncbi:MAG: ATP-binding protein [Candidatus Lokiarchaeota archaeon]|nr:ATP-binding protein [Candidatus Harpocratesius repetitus]